MAETATAIMVRMERYRLAKRVAELEAENAALNEQVEGLQTIATNAGRCVCEECVKGAE